VTSHNLVIRRASIGLLSIWIAVLTVELVQRELGGRAPERVPDIGTQVGAGGDQPVRVHKGFIYSDTLGGVPSFRIAAREAVEYASGWYEFRDVQVSLYHQGEVAYGLLTDRLRYEPSKHQAQTLGPAEVSLQGGIAVRAAGFTLGGINRLLESEGPVTFAGPSWGGVAESAHCSLERDSFELVGGVSVTWRSDPATMSPSVVLLAPRLSYERSQAVVRCPDGVTLLRGRMQLQATGAEVQLAGAEGELRRLSFVGPVRIDGTLDDGSELGGLAGNTEVNFLPGNRLRVAAEPAPTTGWAAMQWEQARAEWREFAAWRVVGEGSRTAWDWLEGQGHACAVDVRTDENPRRVESTRMRIDFKAGQPEVAHAHESVRIDLGDGAAQGEELAFSMATRTFTLLPAAGGRVLLSSPDGTSECDRVTGTEGGGVVAQGQVVGVIERGSLGTASETPVRFAAGSATALGQGSHLVMEGEARLWQGTRLIRADRLEYDREHEMVTGNGAVLTTARSENKSGKAEDVEIHARELHYDRNAGEATYQGDVTMVEPRGQAACQRLVALTNAKGNLVLATLEDGVRLSDKTSGRVISGQRARYLVDDGFVEIWGKPVLVQNATGDQIKAEHLQWRRPTNTVVVLGTEDNPSETQYHQPPAKASPSPGPKKKKP
jgi:lipopolysaccharide export system protein LptA